MQARLWIVFVIALAPLGFLLASTGMAEVALVPHATFTVNSPLDMVDVNPGDGVCDAFRGQRVCTLRAAIQESNALPGPDTVILPAGVYTLTIAGAGEDAAATGDLDITENLTLNGADPEHRVRHPVRRSGGHLGHHHPQRAR